MKLNVRQSPHKLRKKGLKPKKRIVYVTRASLRPRLADGFAKRDKTYPESQHEHRGRFRAGSKRKAENGNQTHKS